MMSTFSKEIEQNFSCYRIISSIMIDFLNIFVPNFQKKTVRINLLDIKTEMARNMMNWFVSKKKKYS